MQRVRWISMLALGRASALSCLAVALSCAGESLHRDPVACAENADCAPGFRCDKGLSPTRGTIPCPGSRPCVDATTCNAGEVCAPNWQVVPDRPECQPQLCGEPCQTTGCPDDAKCTDAGVCELIACDAPDGVACPEHWECDPERAKADPYGDLTGIDALFPDIARTTGHGCAPIPCDAPGAYECEEFYACWASPELDHSRCYPVSCIESGVCPSDYNSVCIEASKHPEFTPDDWGCVPAGCDEGLSCSLISGRGIDVGSCDYSSPDADPMTGCVYEKCQSDADCRYMMVCDWDGAFIDALGCRNQNCLEADICPQGWLCDLSQTADVSGCYEPGTGLGTGGTSGTGGTGGIGTSGTGGTSGAGGTSGTGGAQGGTTSTAGHSGASQGQCVRQ